ncbi:hypothetical protein M0R45_030122 [Rubus argutus]|uniref:Uncharacterized protein n=1 Tax=Rubus argutus TaxID=59490 RepID=A0AAW1WC25_RUBAR
MRLSLVDRAVNMNGAGYGDAGGERVEVARLGLAVEHGLMEATRTELGPTIVAAQWLECARILMNWDMGSGKGGWVDADGRNRAGTAEERQVAGEASNWLGSGSPSRIEHGQWERCPAEILAVMVADWEAEREHGREFRRWLGSSVLELIGSEETGDGESRMSIAARRGLGFSVNRSGAGLGLEFLGMGSGQWKRRMGRRRWSKQSWNGRGATATQQGDRVWVEQSTATPGAQIEGRVERDGGYAVDLRRQEHGLVVMAARK